MQRKVLRLIYVMLLSLFLMACGEDASHDDKIPANETTTAEETTVTPALTSTPTATPTAIPTLTPTPTAVQARLLQDITGMYKANPENKDSWGVEILMVSDKDVLFAVHYVWGGSDDGWVDKYVAYFVGTLAEASEENEFWLIEYDGYDVLGNLVDGIIQINREEESCNFYVEYSDKVYDGAFYMYDMIACKLTGKAETSLSACMKGISDQEAIYKRNVELEKEYLNERKERPYEENFGELHQIDTIKVNLRYVETYTDGYWYYMVFVDDGGIKAYAYTNTRWNLTPNAYYDINGRLFYGNYYVLAIDDIADHIVKPTATPTPVAPKLSSSVEKLDHDAVFYDSNTGLFVLSNVSSNGSPFRMDGIRLIDLDEGVFSFVADMHSKSSYDYLTFFNIKLIAKDGSVLKTYDGLGYCMDDINIRRPSAEEVNRMESDAKNYPVYILTASNMKDSYKDSQLLRKIPGGSDFIVALNYIWCEGDYLTVSQKMNTFSKEIYGVYITVDGYYTWDSIY